MIVRTEGAAVVPVTIGAYHSPRQVRLSRLGTSEEVHGVLWHLEMMMMMKTSHDDREAGDVVS